MFYEVNLLVEEEAWEAMTQDLRQTKAARNDLAKENTVLKRRIEEMELQNREWEALRRNGLIS